MVVASIYVSREVSKEELTTFLKHNGFVYSPHHYGDKSVVVNGKDRPFILSLVAVEDYFFEDDQAKIQSFSNSNQVTVVSIEPRDVGDPQFRIFAKKFCDAFEGIFDINGSTFAKINGSEKFERDAPLKAFLENRTF